VTATAPSDKSLFELPLSALTQDGTKQTIVWTVDRMAATVHARPVTIDTFSDTGIQVSAGLNPGDLVVVAGTQFMTEDMKVRLADENLSRAAEAGADAEKPDAATR
jgi:multidrug efflux pump subunit AcrA (membrane-fusion protein)